MAHGEFTLGFTGESQRDKLLDSEVLCETSVIQRHMPYIQHATNSMWTKRGHILT